MAEFLAHTELIEQERALKGGDFLLEEMDLSYMKPIYPTTDLAKVQAVTKLMFQAVSSETVRITIQEDTDSLKHAQHNANNKLKELKATWESQTSKLTQLMQKQTERQIQSSKDKLESLKQMYKMETRHIEQDLYQRKKRCTVRTIPLGMDKFQNRYWHFQQKSSEWITWGSWIICETGPGLKNPVADKPKRSRKKKTDIETEIKAENSQIKVMNGNGIAPQFELSDSNYNKSVDLSLVDSVKKEELKVKVNGDYQKESKANEVKKPQIKKQALVPNSSILKKEESLLRQPPHPNLKSNLFYVSGKENITQLAKWINCQYPVNEKTPVWVKYLDTYSAILDD